jgi:hypothetical protein
LVEEAIPVSKAFGTLRHATDDLLIMEDYIKIATLENEIEARLLESILNERNVPHRMRSYYDTAYNGLFQTQKGWGSVSAPEGHKKEIMEILTDLRKEANTFEDSSPDASEQN